MSAITKSNDNQASSGEIKSPEEAEVIISVLRDYIRKSEYGPSFATIAAPEIDIFKNVAIVRDSLYCDFSIELINPRIIKAENKVISFMETCISFPSETYNCIRWNDIVLQNGLDKKELTFSGLPAIMIQHAVDHLSGETFHDRSIKAAVVREGGLIRQNNSCPCGSRKRFSECCAKK